MQRGDTNVLNPCHTHLLHINNLCAVSMVQTHSMRMWVHNHDIPPRKTMTTSALIIDMFCLALVPTEALQHCTLSLQWCTHAETKSGPNGLETLTFKSESELCHFMGLVTLVA